MGKFSKMWGAGIGAIIGNIVGTMIDTLTVAGGPDLSGSKGAIVMWISTIVGASAVTALFPANKL